MTATTDMTAAVPAAPGMPPRVQLLQMLSGSLTTQLLAVSAELGLADLVGDRPRQVQELAELTGTDTDALYRILRALAGRGVFSEVAPRTFGLTPLAEALRTGAPGSLRDMARFCGLAEGQRAFAELLYSARTGRPAFDRVFGVDWWSHLAAVPEHAQLFSDAMGSLARQFHAAAVDSYDLGQVRRLVDVGGGHGHLVATILRRYPGMTAVLFDRPDIVRRAVEVLAAHEVADRVEIVGGDFFESVPEGGDAYVLSAVLHDWDDAAASRILRNIRKVMATSGRILVIEGVLPTGNAPHFAKTLDIIMLSLVGGRERTAEEFATLFATAGLQHLETRTTRSPCSVLVAVPGGRDSNACCRTQPALDSASE